MDYVIQNPDLNKILEELDINADNTNLFQHAYKTQIEYDPGSCIKYFENGLMLQTGFDSFLATMSPYDKNKSYVSQIQTPSFRGPHKIIICVPHELEDMFFGSIVNAHGDAGNQYSKNILLDYLINPSSTNYLPAEFILGMYYEGDENNPPTLIENPAFFKNKVNSTENTNNLKQKLATLITNSKTNEISKELIGYCIGITPLTDEEINRGLSTLDKFFNDSKYDVLKQVLNEKKQPTISLEDLVIKGF